MTARSILGLLPETATTRGAVILDGTEVVGLSGERLREIREERRPGSRYATLEVCKREVAAAETLFRQEHLPGGRVVGVGLVG